MTYAFLAIACIFVAVNLFLGYHYVDAHKLIADSLEKMAELQRKEFDRIGQGSAREIAEAIKQLAHELSEIRPMV